MLIRDMNPFARIIFTLTRTPYKKFVRCADSRLFYVLRGSGEITVDGVTYPVEKDCLGLWKAGTEYCWNLSKKNASELVIFNFDYTQTYSDKISSLNLIHKQTFPSKKIYNTPDFDDAPLLNKPIFLSNASIFKKEIMDIHEEFNNQKLFSRELSGSMLNQLILKIARYASSDRRTHSKIEPILEYIRANYSEDITNISLGKMVNYHPHYINLLMKEYTGTTLHSYLTEYRMNEAMKLLLNTDYSIEMISNSTGYKNPTHFCKIFKKKFGTSPSEYRKSSRTI
ncbi:MAG: AraC family transcriptional regulator [Clostridia bacterium]|nr:AraC family transcriptional regulator [Clostridia bacterium]